MKRRATIRDVAIEAKVSITTVSHVLNGKGRSSEETRKLVLSAAKKVGYGADPIARSLRTGQTGVLGIIFRPSDAVSGSMNGTEYHIRVAGGAAAAALSNGYGLLHVPRPMDAARPAFPMDGCVVVAPFRDDLVLEDLLTRGVPVVTSDPDPGRSNYEWSVRRDDRGGMRQLLDHLAARGARRIMLLGGKDANAWNIDTAAAYEQWSQEVGHQARTERIKEVLGSEGARAHADKVFRLKATPDAIVCATSRFATGVIQAAAKAGLRVPQDIMVAALSDSELDRSHTPAITALDLHGDEMGRESVTLLLSRLAGEAAGAAKIVSPTLRIRASTGG